MEYRYFDKSEVDANGFHKALALIKEEKLTISTEHMGLLEAAAGDDFIAWCELEEAFHRGNLKGIPKNYRMARYYLDKIMQRNLQREAPITIVEAYKNSGLLEFDFGNTERAIGEFVKAIQTMAAKVDPKEWNYNIQGYLFEMISML